MSKDKFTISGYEVIEKTAKPHGNGARVLVPRDWSGEDVKIVKATEEGDKKDAVAPVAALMHDSVANEDGDLEDAIQKVVKFKSFSDVPDNIVVDFQAALNSHSTRQSLRQSAEKTDSEEKKQFYNDICSTDSLLETVSRWTR
jgi:putative transposon-encoded protein